MKKEKIVELIKTDKKIAVMLLIGIVGILLIIISEFIPNKDKTEIKKEDNEIVYDYIQENEKKLKNIISKIDGAGKVEIMITLKSGEENKYAVNISSQNKNDEKLNENKTENEYVVIDGANGDECILLKTEFPQVQGVVVVCEGGDNSRIKNDITNAVSALLNISTNNISVLKMKTTED